MKLLKLLAIPVLALALLVTTPTQLDAIPETHSKTVTQVLDSLSRLTGVNENGDTVFVCTAWSIGPKQFVTAAHCTPDAIEVNGHEFPVYLELDGIPAVVLKRSFPTDLATLLGEIRKPALEIREEPLSRFEEVKAAGFGHGFPRPLVTEHRVMILGISLGDDVWPGTVFMHPFVGGMSGGVIFDNDGKVVGVVQRASPYIGFGIDSATLLAFLR